MQVDFYQLGNIAPARVLAGIAGNVLKGGGRLLVIEADEAAAAALDEALWTKSADGFLPHGRAADGDAGADQPVLIATRGDATNGARNIAFADGLWREAGLAFDRAFLLFDEAATPGARTAWRRLGEAVTRNYWAREDGRWVRKA